MTTATMTRTTTQAEFAARVPDAAKRLEAERLFNETGAAYDRLDGAITAGIRAKYQPMLDAAEAEHRKRMAEIEAQMAAEAGVSALQAAHERARTAWEDFDCQMLETDDDGEVEHCALSGLPLFDGDPIIEDTETGEKVLKVCLGVLLDESEAFRLPASGAAAEAA